MGFFARLMMFWNALLPYMTADNVASVQKVFDNVITDYKGGDWGKAVDDLAAGIKAVLPSQAHGTIDDVTTGN